MIQIADKTFMASMQLIDDLDSFIFITSLKLDMSENDVKSFLGGFVEPFVSISYVVLRAVSKTGTNRTNLKAREMFMLRQVAIFYSHDKNVIVVKFWRFIALHVQPMKTVFKHILVAKLLNLIW